MNSLSVHDLFYESEPGVIRWKIDRINGGFANRVVAAAGSIAGTLHKRSGRWYIRLNGRYTSRARIIWMLHNGEIKEGKQIDHINRDHSNDRIENLRLSTASENCCNKGKRSDNTSGFKGVSWNRDKNKWTASICVQQKQKYLGAFYTAEEAYKAYCEAASKLHGDFSYAYNAKLRHDA
jgi:hypothetical protein